MDDTFIDDDFGRKPGAPRPDYDAELAGFKRDFENTPDTVHASHEDEMHAFLGGNTAREVFSNKREATLVDDPEDIRRIEQAAAKDAAAASHAEAAKAGDKMAADALDVASGAAPGSASPAGANRASGAEPFDSPAATGAQNAANAPKPTSLESTLANIRLDGKRQQRLVISGDPMIERAFYEKLAERGQVFYQGGAPVITLSRAKAIAVLQETAKEFEGATAKHAMSLQLDRDGGGILGSIKASLANNLPSVLGRRHEIDVVVVGKQDVVEAKLKELGGLVTDMERNGHVKEGAATVEKGMLKLSEDKPAQLDGTARLYDVLTSVKNKVDAYNTQQSTQQQELREHKTAKDLESMAKSKEKDGPGVDKDGNERPNQHAQKLVDSIDKGFQDSNLLHVKNGKGQVEALALLQQSRGLKDPTERELQTLPDADRQKAIVQMAALIEKVDNKEFGAKLGGELDKHKADTSSIRQKVSDYIAMEAARDPAFAAKVEPLLKDMVERKVLTEEQAASVTGKVADAVLDAKHAAATAAPAAAAQENSSETKVVPALKELAERTGLTEEQAVHVAQKVVEAQSAEKAATSKDAAPATSATESSAASTSTKEGATQASGAESASASTSTSSTAQQASSEKSAPAADKPLELRDRIEAIAADGPSKLTADKAHTLVAELDAIRTKPLSSLDAGSGDKPTQTLVRAEGLLKELESGRLGPELKAQAKDLAEPLAKWSEQDAARYEKAPALSPAQRAEVVSDVKSTESAWHGAAKVTAAENAGTSTSASHSASSGATQTASTAPAQDAASKTSSVSQSGSASTTQEFSSAPARDTAREQAAQRLMETESAGGKLSMMMANPAGSFTNRDKSWNQESIQRAASEVLRIDPESAAQLSAQQRTKLAVYSSWLADNASQGKLPGFTSEEGKATAKQLVERSAVLIGKMEDGAKLSPEVQKSVEKADRMVGAMEQLEKSAGMSSQSVREESSRGGISPAAASALAKDLVHSVYRQPEMTDAQAKYLLKNAVNLTPETTKTLDPQTRAQTAVAMSHIAQQVRDGAMGDFSKLPNSVQKNVLSASSAAETLLTSMGKDPSMRAELNQAYTDFHARGASASKTGSNEMSTGGSSAVSTGAAKSADASATKQEGRSLDR